MAALRALNSAYAAAAATLIRSAFSATVLSESSHVSVGAGGGVDDCVSSEASADTSADT